MSTEDSSYRFNLKHSQRARIAKGEGLFKRQYINLLSGTRTTTINDCWKSVKRDLRLMKTNGVIDDNYSKRAMRAGREIVDEHVQVLAIELDRYGMLNELLTDSV